MHEHEKPWSPLSIDEINDVLAQSTFPWWIAGGYAIDLAVGRRLRYDGDIDVLILHRDHLEARSLLSSWDC